MKYAVVIEPSENGFGAYVPDLPGCVAVGDTVEETLKLIQEAIELHFEEMREDGIPIAKPTSRCEYVTLTVQLQRLS